MPDTLYPVLQSPGERSTAPRQHAVQLFDGDGSAADALARFVAAGFAGGEHILIIARLDDWNRAAVNLARQALPLSEAIGSGQLAVCESRRMRDALLVDGWPSAERFADLVGRRVQECVARGAGLRAYGDMVDLLAAEGAFDAAARLEELWNDLQDRVPFTLFCGYSASHFCQGHGREALPRIRQLHTHEHRVAEDVVANQLMDTVALSI